MQIELEKKLELKKMWPLEKDKEKQVELEKLEKQVEMEENLTEPLNNEIGGRTVQVKVNQRAAFRQG